MNNNNNNNNSNNNNKYNFNYEEVGEIKDLLEAVIIDIDDVRALSILLAKFFTNRQILESEHFRSFIVSTNFSEYGVLAEEIPKKLYNLQEELEDIVKNKLEVKK